MVEENTETEEIAEPQVIIDATATEEETALENLKNLQENFGQVLELSKEETSLVNEFFKAFADILKHFGETLEISVSSLPRDFRERTNKSFLDKTGKLIIVTKKGEVETFNLMEHRNYNILFETVGDIVTKLGALMNSQRAKIEKRVKILMPITKELQKVAKVLEEL